jgi:hypothetical protein
MSEEVDFPMATQTAYTHEAVELVAKRKETGVVAEEVDEIPDFDRQVGMKCQSLTKVHQKSCLWRRY